MAKNRIELLEDLRKAGSEGDVDFLREGIKVLAEAVMEMEVTRKTGAGLYERSDGRHNYRNGYRERWWDTRVGTVNLNIPRLRSGTYFPSLLEPRRRAEQALLSVVQEAYVLGVSTRKVDKLVKALGMDGISKSEVSRICQDLDEEVNQWRNRLLEGAYPYLWLDATYIKARDNGRVTNLAVVVAYGVRDTGEREIIGIDIGPSEDGAFWTAFLRNLVSRGLKGVLLVISDAHVGLINAIATTLTGAGWQRCRVHFMRNALAKVHRGDQSIVAAAIRSIFTQPDKDTAREQLRRVSDSLQSRFVRVSEMLDGVEDDLLACMDFPREHWRQISTTNPLERVNREIKRRTNVVGIFPNRDAVIRLVGAVLMEQQDEWTTGRRYFSTESMRKVLQSTVEEAPTGELQLCGV
jgi:putative transposase